MKPKNIKIGGKMRPVYFGMLALSKFEELSGIKLAQFEKEMSDLSMSNLLKFVYSGLYGGAKYKHIQLDFKIEDVSYWMDDYGFNNVDKLMEIYMDAMPMVADSKIDAPKKDS